MLRRFNGTSDEWKGSIGGSSLTGNFSVVVFGRVEIAEEGTLVSLWDATTERFTFGINASKQPRMKIGATIINGGEIEVVPTTGQFGIWGVSKEAGEKFSRWHHFGFDTGIWKHANDGTLIGNPVTQAGGTVRIGGGPFGFVKNDFAAVLIATKALSDGEFEALKSSSFLSAWIPSAAGLWLFKQSSTAEAVSDSTGNGANQTELIGTTVLEEEPPIPYEERKSGIVIPAAQRAARGLILR